MTRYLLALVCAVAGWLPLPAQAGDKVKIGFISSASTSAMHSCSR